MDQKLYEFKVLNEKYKQKIKIYKRNKIFYENYIYIYIKFKTK